MTPPHCHGHARRCADVCIQEEQAADSWAKAKTYALLEERDSRRGRQRAMEKEAM